MQFGFSRRKVARHASHETGRRPLRRRRPSFDCLEDRRLLSSGGTLDTSNAQLLPVAGAALPGDTLNPADVQSTGNHAVAMDSKGDSVIVWGDSPTDPVSHLPTGPWTLNFQLYTENGGTLTASAGGKLQEQLATTNLVSPTVAMAPTSGEFVILWQVESTNSYGYNVISTYAEPFDGSGNALAAPIQVGATGQARPLGVAMTDNGFDVLYGAPPPRYKSAAPDYQALTVQQYSNTGAAVGKPITVTTESSSGTSASISAEPGGSQFVVGWSDFVVGKHGSANYNTLNWQRYTSGGSILGGVVNQNTQGNSARSLDLAMDSSDDIVFTWNWNTGGGVQVQAVDSGNNLISGSQINPDPGGGSPSVAIAPNGSGYALSWSDGGSVMAATYSLGGAVEQSPFAVYTAPSFVYNGMSHSLGQTASAAIDGAGNVLVAYSGYFTDNSSTVYTDGGVFGDFYLDPPAPAATPSTSTSSSLIGVASPSDSTTAAADAVFASYAFPEDDDALA